MTQGLDRVLGAPVKRGIWGTCSHWKWEHLLWDIESAVGAEEWVQRDVPEFQGCAKAMRMCLGTRGMLSYQAMGLCPGTRDMPRYQGGAPVPNSLQSKVHVGEGEQRSEGHSAPGWAVTRDQRLLAQGGGSPLLLVAREADTQQQLM